MWRWGNWLGRGVVCLGLFGLLGLVIITAQTKLRGEGVTAGIRQSASEYVK